MTSHGDTEWPDGSDAAAVGFMTLTEAARFLRVEVVDVREAIREGCVRVAGWQPLVDREALLYLLDPSRDHPMPSIARMRIDAVADGYDARLGAGYVSPAWRTAASTLLEDMLMAAQGSGIALRDFDCVTNLPSACLDSVAPWYRRRPYEQPPLGPMGW